MEKLVLPVNILPVTINDRTWISLLIKKTWGDEFIIVHDEIFFPCSLPGFIAKSKNENLGLVTYNLQHDHCEIITINSLREFQGIGSALLEEVITVVKNKGVNKISVVTTNDNLLALRFYQKRGFVLSSVSVGAIGRSRAKKPHIPTFGLYGIPLRDEITLEFVI